MRRGAASDSVPEKVLTAGVGGFSADHNTLFVSAFPQHHPAAGYVTNSSTDSTQVPGGNTMLVLLPEPMDTRFQSATPIGASTTRTGQTAELGQTQAKRRLELEADDPDYLPPDVGGISMMLAASPTTTAHRQKQAKSNDTTPVQGFTRPSSSTAPNTTRYDTSLGLMTHRFLQLLARSHNGIVDLNVASRELSVHKRRLYDITNVLEGVQLLKKKAKNNIQWMGCQLRVDSDQEVSYSTVDPRLLGEIDQLQAEERRLDELIHSCTREVNKQCKDRGSQRFAYMTYEDIKRIPCLKGQTMIVIKAPEETKLEVAHPDECLQIHLRSTQGPIEVYLCSDDCMPLDNTDGYHGSLSHSSPNTKATASSFKVSSPDGANHSPRHNVGDGFSSLSSGRTESSHLSLSVASSSSSSSPLAPACLTHSSDQQKFVTLTPPLNVSLTGSDYLLGMGKDEGITDLFSSVDIDCLSWSYTSV